VILTGRSGDGQAAEGGVVALEGRRTVTAPEAEGAYPASSRMKTNGRIFHLSGGDSRAC
jgi:hypothetical protein